MRVMPMSEIKVPVYLRVALGVCLAGIALGEWLHPLLFWLSSLGFGVLAFGTIYEMCFMVFEIFYTDFGDCIQNSNRPRDLTGPVGHAAVARLKQQLARDMAAASQYQNRATRESLTAKAYERFERGIARLERGEG